MGASDSNSPFDDPSYSRERLELETRVLAAALRQSLEIGDTAGSSLAHEQIFLLLKASQDMVLDEPVNLPREVFIEKGRQLPDIDWGSSDDGGGSEPVSLPAEALSVETNVPTADSSLAETPTAGEFSQAAAGAEASDAAQSTALSEDDRPEPGENEPGPDSSPSSSSPSSEIGQPAGNDFSAAPPAETVSDNDAEVIQPLTTLSQAVELSNPEPSKNDAPPDENDYYGQLRVTDLVDFASIHQAFLRMLRVLLRQEVGLIGPERQPHLKRIQKLWIAHDILCDPVTRADYDFRRMGLRGGEHDEETTMPPARKTLGPRIQLRIGELLQCAGLLEQTELDIAADMHKAMPEMMFGTFLVKQGFIEEDDLNCVLVGQQLLKTGDITVVQFQTVMIERSATGLDIGEMLKAKGYVSEAMLERAYRNQAEDTLVKVPVVLPANFQTKIDARPHPHPQPVAGGAERAAQGAADAASGAFAPAIAEPSSGAHPAPVVGLSPSDTGDAEPTITGEPPVLEENRLTEPEIVSDSPNLISERTFNLGNAAPAWKDQLDWSSPEPEVGSQSDLEVGSQSETEVGAQSELAPEPEPEAISGFAPVPVAFIPEPTAEFVAEVPPLAEPSSLQENPQQGEESIDMVDSVQTIAQIWDAPALPVSPWDRPPQSAELNDNPFVSSQSASESIEQPTDSDENLALDRPAPDAVRLEKEGSPLDDHFSEVETSGNLPSLRQLELQARSAEENQVAQSEHLLEDHQQPASKEHEDRRRATGDWQIMSVPASALTSLFLDEEPVDPFMNSSRDDQSQTGPRAVHPVDLSASHASNNDQQESTEVAAEDSPSQGQNQGQNQAQAQPQPVSTPTRPESEARRNRRRRTKQ